MKKGKSFMMVLGTGGLLGAGITSGSSTLLVLGIIIGVYTLYKV